MTTKIKRFTPVVREGLIILGIILGIVVFFICNTMYGPFT